MQAKIGVMQPQPKNALNHQKLGEAKKEPPREPLDFWSPECEIMHLGCFKHHCPATSTCGICYSVPRTLSQSACLHWSHQKYQAGEGRRG